MTLLLPALLGTLAVVGGLATETARAATVAYYGPPNAAAWSLSGHAVEGGAGTLPNEYPSPKPWNLAAGDYCSAYKFAQPNAPTTRAVRNPSATSISPAGPA